MKKLQPAASKSSSGACSPFKDLTNTPVERDANPTSGNVPKKQTWYSRLTNEERKEYLEKQRVARQQK